VAVTPTIAAITNKTLAMATFSFMFIKEFKAK
jgi:hypothetical protein